MNALIRDDQFDRRGASTNPAEYGEMHSLPTTADIQTMSHNKTRQNKNEQLPQQPSSSDNLVSIGVEQDLLVPVRQENDAMILPIMHNKTVDNMMLERFEQLAKGERYFEQMYVRAF